MKTTLSILITILISSCTSKKQTEAMRPIGKDTTFNLSSNGKDITIRNLPEGIKSITITYYDTNNTSLNFRSNKLDSLGTLKIFRRGDEPVFTTTTGSMIWEKNKSTPAINWNSPITQGEIDSIHPAQAELKKYKP